jgi:hypothetical protein
VTRRLPLLVGALALATLIGTADAGRFSVHVGGSAHFSAGAHWSTGVRVGGYGGYYRPGYYGYRGGYGGYYRPWWGVRGSIYVGGYYPYYYPGYSYYYPVPSYYEGSYYPVQPTASVYAGPSTVAVVAPPPPLPRFGVGVFAGGVSTDHNSSTNTSENDLGLLGRFRLTDGLLIEGELSRVTTSVKDPSTGQTVDNARVDRRLGGALLYEIGARNRFAPFVLAGLGVEQANTNGNYNTTQDYAEIGAGLRFALSRNFHISLDARVGQRNTVANDSPTMAPPSYTTASTVTPPSTSAQSTSEDYTRLRLSALLYF